VDISNRDADENDRGFAYSDLRSLDAEVSAAWSDVPPKINAR
jgi:hypothetical protein